MEKMTNQELMALRQENIPKGVSHATEIAVRRAKGALIEDVEGKKYIDFAGGGGAENVGHCAEPIVSAIKEQAEQFIHTSFQVNIYESYIALAKILNESVPGTFQKKTFFVNSGTEAVENAIKIARYATKRQAIIAFENAFHGRTYMAMSLTSKIKPYKWGFGPLCPEVYQVPFAYCYRCHFGLEYPSCQIYCADYLEQFFERYVPAESVAAIIAEPVQGEGGIIVPPPEYFTKLKGICEKYGILFIADEIQTGMGRTGKLFACEHFGVIPDLIVIGKSIGAGLPLASVTGKAEIMDKIHPGGLGTTYGGNPLACKVGVVVFGMIRGGILEKAVAIGKKVQKRFFELKERYKLIGEVRGLGPMQGIEMVRDRLSKEPAVDEGRKVTKRCAEKGLIILSCGIYRQVIRTLMPLVITDDQLERGLDILDSTLRELSQT
jgi:4-aminobutyrate aminotransferase/(S)-3-amino-2-methylpropionate transaminase